MSTLAAYNIGPDVDPLTFNVKLDDLQQIPNCTLHIKTGQDGTYDQHIPYVVNSSVTLDSGIVVLMGDFGLPTILTGLKRTTQYYFYVSNASGNTNGIVVQYDGAVDTTRPAPSGIVVTASNDSATISWVSEAGATNSVEWGISTNYGNTPVAATSGADPTATLTNLNGNTTYYFRVKSTDANGNTGYGILMTSSPVGTFRTTAINTHGDLLWVATIKAYPAAGVPQPGADLKGVAFDSLGNVFACGNFVGTVQLNGQPAVSHPYGDGLLVKFDSSGVMQWARDLKATGTGSNITPINAIKIDSAGDIIVAGTFSGIVDFGGTILTSPQSQGGLSYTPYIFVAKYRSGGSLNVPGALVWVKQFESANESTPNAIALDSSNNIYVAGRFGSVGSQTLDFGNGVTVVGSGHVGGGTGSYDLFVTKLNSLGLAQWGIAHGTPDSDHFANGLAVDSAGGVYVTGDARKNRSDIQAPDGISLGGTVFTPLGKSDTFSAKYSGINGAHTYSHRWGSIEADYLPAVVVNPDGDHIVCGSMTKYSGTYDLLTVNYGGTAGQVSGSAVVLVKYHADGTVAWDKVFAGQGPAPTLARAVAVNPLTKDIIVAGQFRQGTVYFGLSDTGQFLNLYYPDYFVMAFDTEGHVLWHKASTGTQTFSTNAKAVAVSTTGTHVATAGVWVATTTFEGGVTIVSPPNTVCGFVAKYVS